MSSMVCLQLPDPVSVRGSGWSSLREAGVGQRQAEVEDLFQASVLSQQAGIPGSSPLSTGITPQFLFLMLSSELAIPSPVKMMGFWLVWKASRSHSVTEV